MKPAAIVSTLVLTGTLVAGTPAVAQNEPLKVHEDSPVARIRTVGEDGGLFFVVFCKSGKEGSIEKYDTPPEVCVGPPRECRASWDLVAAAESMCRK